MPKPSRRTFLGAAAASAAAAPAPAAPSPFKPGSKPCQISPNLLIFEDTCNVYIVRSGLRAVLIDFGSGAVLDHLAGLGVSSIDGINHTHHHLDRCQGDSRAVARNIPIHVTEAVVELAGA